MRPESDPLDPDRCACNLLVVESSPDKVRRRSRWQPPPDSDLVGVPLVLGAALAVLAILAAFFFIGWVGLVVLVVILIAALAISFRVMSASDPED